MDQTVSPPDALLHQLQLAASRLLFYAAQHALQVVVIAWDKVFSKYSFRV
jgi:hypothetical protein